MALPKRRKSKSKSRMRRSHDALVTPNLVICKNCGNSIIPHRVCPGCGWYKDRVVIEPKIKISKKDRARADQK
jgi:large subunit ribosomal protein L32